MLYSHEKLSFDRYVVFPARSKAYANSEVLMARHSCKFAFLFLTLFLVVLLEDGCFGKEKKPDPKNKKEKSSKIGKNVMDYTEADLHKLLDQWEVSTKT